MTTRANLFGRLTARLTGRTQLERLAALEEKVAKFGRAQREEQAQQREQLEALAAQVSTRAGHDSIRDLQHRIEHVLAALSQQDRTVAEALERAQLLDEQGVDDRRFARRVEQLLRHDRPIIVGPWTGEVGFELLYWTPFVRWVVGKYGLPTERLVVVSRGGTSGWYGSLASHYADIFLYCSPEEFRDGTAERKKQRRVGAFDAEIVRRVIEGERLQGAELLHPGMMYRLFMPFWRELATAARVEAYTSYARLQAYDDPVVRQLPTEYVAARFYFSDCFPDTAANRALIGSTIESISRHLPVVLLNAPFEVDDHRDFTPANGRVHTIGSSMTPERNLALQSAVVARARAFVGTYGGYSYLAPFHGVTSIAFYSDRTFKPHHLHLAQRVFDRLGGATLVPLDTTALPLVRLSLAGLQGAVLT